MTQRLIARGIPTISCDLSHAMAANAPGPAVCVDEEALPFAPHSFDLVTASLSLHWINDLPGTFRQICRILKPDGLFLASVPILPTLRPLRQALEDAELALCDGVSPRVSPSPPSKTAPISSSARALRCQLWIRKNWICVLLAHRTLAGFARGGRNKCPCSAQPHHNAALSFSGCFGGISA